MGFSAQYRRRRQGKTNYHKRLKLLQSGETRFVVRRSNTGIVCQFIAYEAAGDKILASATAKDVKAAGLTQTSAKSLPASYLTGYIAGVKAKKAGVSGAIVDIGMQTATKGNRLFAAVKGALDAGITMPVGADMLPTQERIEGKHIADHRNVTFNITALKQNIKP
jgi:large subunit ribosomal protein L18